GISIAGGSQIRSRPPASDVTAASGLAPGNGLSHRSGRLFRHTASRNDDYVIALLNLAQIPRTSPSAGAVGDRNAPIAPNGKRTGDPALPRFSVPAREPLL